jgi:hypothetical protein
MHFFGLKENFFGGHGIVGAQIGTGAGLAFAERYRGTKNVVLCFFGDGAARQGMLHETFNLAMLWKLPVIFICENNNYAMGTSVERTSNVTDIYKLADAYEMPADIVDGMSPEAVHEAVARAVKRAREGGGPTLLEMKTYRYKGHSMSDPQKYRSKDEVEEYKEKDPIEHCKNVLLTEFGLAEADIEESPFTWAAKNTPKGDKFSVGGKEFVKNDAFAFEALDKQLNALLEDKEVTEGMTVSISKGQQGSPDSVSVSAQDGEADQLLSVIKSAGLGLFGGDDAMSQGSHEPMTVDNGGEPAEVGAGGTAIEVVDDHDGMMNLMKKLSGIGGGEHAHSHDEESEETCESCGGMMEAGHACGEGEEMIGDQLQLFETGKPRKIAPNSNTDLEIIKEAAHALGLRYKSHLVKQDWTAAKFIK